MLDNRINSLPDAALPSITDIRTHVELLHTLAAPLEGKGKLIAASYGQDPSTGLELPPYTAHFAIGDIEAMAQWIFRLTVEPNRNVYVPLAVFRPSLGRGRKGGEEDIIAVLGLVADFDDADAASYNRRLPKPADYVLETSLNRYQAFYLFAEPILMSGEEVVSSAIKQVAVKLKNFAKCDHGTADLSHVWRISGTLNAPNEKKAKEGRPLMPQQVCIEYSDSGSRTNFDELASLLIDPLSSPTTSLEGSAQYNVGIEELMTGFSPWLCDLINSKGSKGKRSDNIFTVVKEFIRRGLDDKKITEIIEYHPSGIGEKYVGRNDLDKEVARIREKLKENHKPVDDPDIANMNKKYAVVPVGNKVAIMSETIDPTGGEVFLQLFKRADLQLLHSNQFVSVGKKEICIADYWITHPYRRGYQGIVFDPTCTPEHYYNLFRGFPIKPAEGDCSLYLIHIRDNICCGDKHLFNYVICWMADAIQNPAKRPGVALVLRGQEGVGKGVFASEFGKLFGVHFVAIYHGHHLTGHFNAHMEGKLLMFADEAFWAGEKASVGILKSLITEDHLMLERKGFDAIKVRNSIRLILASNNDWIVPAGVEARRFLVLDVSNAQRRNTTYFKAILNEMENGGREALMKLLLAVPLGNMDLRTVPQTQALFDNKVHSFEPIERWWYEALVRGEINPFLHWPAEIPCADIYSEFLNDRKLQNDRYRPDESELGRKLKKLTDGKIAKIRKRDDPGKQFGQKDRRHFYVLPSLKDCRSIFSKVLNFDIEWED